MLNYGWSSLDMGPKLAAQRARTLKEMGSDCSDRSSQPVGVVLRRQMLFVPQMEYGRLM